MHVPLVEAQGETWMVWPQHMKIRQRTLMWRLTPFFVYGGGNTPAGQLPRTVTVCGSGGGGGGDGGGGGGLGGDGENVLQRPLQVQLTASLPGM